MPELMVFMTKGGGDKPGEVSIGGVKYLPVMTVNDANFFRVPMRFRTALQGQGFVEVANPGV